MKNILCKILITIQKEQQYNTIFVLKYTIIIAAFVFFFVCKQYSMLYNSELIISVIYILKNIITNEPENLSKCALILLIISSISQIIISTIIMFEILLTHTLLESIQINNQEIFNICSIILIIGANALYICNDIENFIKNMKKDPPKLSHHMAVERARMLPKFCRAYTINYYTNGTYH